MTQQTFDRPYWRAYFRAMYGMLSEDWQTPVQAFLDQGGDISILPPDGNATILHMAASDSRVDAIRWLVAHGAPVNAATRSGWTPLHATVTLTCQLAQENDRMPSFAGARTLLELGAYPYLRDGKGRTPRDIVAGCGLPILARYDVIVYATWAVRS